MTPKGTTKHCKMILTAHFKNTYGYVQITVEPTPPPCWGEGKREREAGNYPPSLLVSRLMIFFGRDAERDPPVNRHGVKLNVETLSISMRPRSSDARPDGLLPLRVAHLVGDVAGRL